MLELLKKIKITEIEEEIKRVNQEYLSEEHYNWFDKNIFKRKEYKSYLENKKRKYEAKLSELESIKNKYAGAMCIQQLGYDLQTAIAMLRQHSLSEVITEKEVQEKVVMRTKPPISETTGLILIHKTNYVPNNGIIKSVKAANVYRNIEVQIAGHTIPMRIQLGRDTVHFSVNGEVQEHAEGNAWDSCKYAVLIPFNDISREQYACVRANDTYTKGSVTLSNNSWILVPQGEAATVRKNNPNVNVIEYEGATVTGYADKLVGMLGYSHERIDPGAGNGWRDETDNRLFGQLITREGFPSGIHYSSQEKYEEMFYVSLQIIIKLIKYVEENPELLNDPQFVEGLHDEIRHMMSITSGKLCMLCKDVYEYLMLEGYELPYDVIVKLGMADEQYSFGVQYELATEIVKMIKNNCEMSLKKTK